MSNFVNMRERLARKEHVCSLCKEPIAQREKYYNYAGRYDGKFFEEKYHLVCLRVVLAYCAQTYDDLYSDDEVYEWARETACKPCERYDSCFASCFRCEIALERLSAGGPNDG